MKKRKDGRYSTKIVIQGKTHYIYAYSISELNEKKFQLKSNSAIKKSNLKDVIDIWYKVEKSNLQYNTQKMYRNLLGYIEPLFLMPINRIQTKDVLDILEPFTNKSRTYNLILLTLNQIFEFAIDENYLERNIVKKIKPIKKIKEEKKPLTLEQIKLIEYSLDLEPRLFICYFLICTGLRREELIPLTYEDIDLKNKIIHINKAVYFEHNQPKLKTTKNECNRDIPILDNLKIPIGNGLIFPNEQGKMMSETIYKRKIAWCSKYLDIPFTGHTLRHTYATMLYNSGVPIKEAQYFLGHKDIRILLNVYTHLTDEQKNKSINQLNNYLKLSK